MAQCWWSGDLLRMRPDIIFRSPSARFVLSVQIVKLGHCREVQGGYNEAVPQLLARFYLYYGNDAHGFVGII